MKERISCWLASCIKGEGHDGLTGRLIIYWKLFLEFKKMKRSATKQVRRGCLFSTRRREEKGTWRIDEYEFVADDDGHN